MSSESSISTASPTQELPFWKDAWARRFPQITASYLVGGWSIIQFVDWMVKRYLLSPYLVDLLLVLFLLLLPSVIMLTWNHGRPGKDRWLKREKIFLPFNILLTLAVLFFGFKGKSFGASAQTVVVSDEEGQEIERVVPTAAFRQKLAIFYADNESGDVSIDFWKSGFGYGIAYDLIQDMYLSQVNLVEYLYRVRQLGLDSPLDLPFALQKQLAGEWNTDWFCNSSYNRVGEEFQLTTRLYRTGNGRLVQERSFNGSDPFALIDLASVQLRKDVGVPENLIDAQEDLPLSEILTDKPEAYRHLLESFESLEWKNDYPTAAAQMDQAVTIDPDFALAWFRSATIQGNLGRTDRLVSDLEEARKRLYRMPERLQFTVKSIHYLLNEDADKRLKVIEMWAELYPADLTPRITLAQIHQLQGETKAAIDDYEIALTIDDNRGQIFLELAGLYIDLGEFDKAETYYEQYAERYPDNNDIYERKGRLYLASGRFDEALEYFEKAHLIDPDDVSARCRMGQVYLRRGEDQKAAESYSAALASSRSAIDSGTVYGYLENHLFRLGKMNEAVAIVDQKLKTYARYQFPINQAFFTIAKMDYLQLGGREAEAENVLKIITDAYGGLYEDVDGFAELRFAMNRRDADAMDSALIKVERYVESYGNLHRPMMLGRAYSAEFRSDYDKATEVLKAIIAEQPGTAGTTRVQLARVYRLNGDLKSAKAELERVSVVYPHSTVYLLELAYYREAAGNEKGAKAALDELFSIWSEADREYVRYLEARELAGRLGLPG